MPERDLRAHVSALLDTLRHQARDLEDRVRFHDVGTVQQVGSSVATISGLPNARMDELVTFPTGVQGMVLDLTRKQVNAVLLGSGEGIQGGDLVTGTGHRLRVPVGPRLLGRVLNSLGRPLDGRRRIDAAGMRHVEREAPRIVAREPVNEPLYTGLKAIDALVPIGRGQRELIVGERQTGKTTIAVDAILRQRGTGVRCVYVAIGQKKSSTLSVIQTLREHGALEHTTVIVAYANDPPALRYLAPFSGCTMAEFLMEDGADVLIIFDDLTKHADAYRELSLLLRRPPGREAYPSDIFYLHARLLERACKLSGEAGGASLTALPIVEIQRGNLAAYIPTNLISITDGQIVLDSDLFNRGIKPAVNVGASVSRVGGAAQTEAMREVAGDLRLELSQYEEVARFARFGTDIDPLTQRQIRRGEHLQAALKQPAHRPLPLARQLVILLAATEGYLDDIPVEQVPAFERALQERFESDCPEWVGQLERTGELTDETREQIEGTIEALRRAWFGDREPRASNTERSSAR